MTIYLIDNVEVLDAQGNILTISANNFLIVFQLHTFFDMLRPRVSEETKKSVSSLYYRDHITINFSINKSGLFPDQWIYIHDSDGTMARVANYNNCSKAMVSDENKTATSVEN